MIRYFNSYTQKVGGYGEEIAVMYLEGRGFEVVLRNHQVSYGEIDIIAKKQGIVYFFEIKTGFIGGVVDPIENITKKKKGRLIKSVLLYCKENNIFLYRIVFLLVYLDKKNKKALVKTFPFEW